MKTKADTVAGRTHRPIVVVKEDFLTLPVVLGFEQIWKIAAVLEICNLRAEPGSNTTFVVHLSAS